MSIAPAILRRGGVAILYDANAIAAPEPNFFESRHRAGSSPAPLSEGRGGACVIREQGMDMVLRHYRRGGLMARLADDRYVWTGLEKTRPWREWRLTAEMHEQGLPVPRPVAARVTRGGLLYSADLATEYLPGTATLSNRLRRDVLDRERWRRIGAAIRDFHDAGICHADLNAMNILLDDNGRVCVIDFDKARRRPMRARWQQANLARLQRSLIKLRTLEPEFAYDPDDWAQLLAGYDR